MIRSVDEDELLRLVERTVKDAVRRGTKDPAASAVTKLKKHLAERPRLPRLLGVTEAAEVLGIRKPHLYRLRDQGRLPEPLLTLMAGQLFSAEEIEALAAELQTERSARATKREDREAREAMQPEAVAT